jgi:hypothetical protein
MQAGLETIQDELRELTTELSVREKVDSRSAPRLADLCDVFDREREFMPDDECISALGARAL